MSQPARCRFVSPARMMRSLLGADLHRVRSGAGWRQGAPGLVQRDRAPGGGLTQGCACLVRPAATPRLVLPAAPPRLDGPDATPRLVRRDAGRFRGAAWSLRSAGAPVSLKAPTPQQAGRGGGCIAAGTKVKRIRPRYVRGPRPEVGPLGYQDAMNSFHLRTMYWFSSMTEFQQATEPMRSSKEPPSRTSPATASWSPVGEVMTSVAGLPSNQ